MKKTLFCMIGAALVAGCSKTEIENTIPDEPSNDYTPKTEYIEIGVATTDDDSRATYDASLHAYWEAADQILGVQGFACGWSAGGNEKTVSANILNLKSGDGTSSARFGGDINTQRNAATYFHFAYPVSGTTLSSYGKVGAWDFNVESSTQTTTCTFTVPAEQDGKWTPFFCASTADKVTIDNIKSVTFGKSLNAAFGIRVFASDKATPKKLQSIKIVAENNITGTLSATTDNDGSFSGKTFTANATGDTITAENPQYTEGTDSNGRTYYEYRFEVLPVNAGVISLTLTADDGSLIERTTSAKTFTANKRSGVNVIWDAATVSMDNATSWYEDSADGNVSTIAGNVIRVKNIEVGGVAAANVEAVGVYVKAPGASDFKAYKLDSAKLQITTDDIAANAGSGVYTVYPYAKIKGIAEEIVGGEQTIIVTDKLEIASHTIRSSYNANAGVAKTNSFDGDKIGATVTLNDAYAQANLVNSVTLHYGDATVAGKVKDEFQTASIARQVYNCYVEVVMNNGLTYKTPAYTINVTGIPYDYTFDGKKLTTIKEEWTCKGNVDDDGLIAHNKDNAGYIVSKNMFYLPNNEDIQVAFTLVHRYYRATFSTGTANAYIGVSANADTASVSGIKCEASSTNGTEGKRTNTGNIVLTNATKYLSISADKNDYGISNHYINSIRLDYK